MILNPVHSLRGEIKVPGDKSISHRAIMLGSLANEKTVITNFLQADDCISTIECFRKMGVQIENDRINNIVTIHGNGLHGLRKPDATLDVGNSGTTIRLISGILAGQNFTTTITGDESIQKRPMNRIIKPLLEMNASIQSLNHNGCAPLIINKHHNISSLRGINYISPVASAQIKSCILLAGLYANDKTTVTEPLLSRNHTELMLEAFGGKVESNHNIASILPKPNLIGQKIEVPGDISSAAYFIAAGLLVANSEIIIKSVGINPTRDGIIEVCQKMGAHISLENKRYYGKELVADIIVKSSQLKGIEISGNIIPRLIDEIPIIAVMATFAQGKTIIKDAAELKVKESNRIDIMVRNLSKMGAQIIPTDDGMIIHGNSSNSIYSLNGSNIDTLSDHRIAMSFAIAALLANGETKMNGSECINISYPEFFKDLNSLIE